MATAVKEAVTFRYSHSIGRRENGGLGFRVPVALTCGLDDVIYVVNRSAEYKGATRITMCTVGEEYVGEFGRGKSVDPPLVWPSGIAAESNGTIHVIDEWLNRVFTFTKDGEFIASWGSAGSGDGELNGPSGIECDAEDNLYVVDSKNNRIQKFTADGRFLGKFGGEGTGEGQFNLPWGIDIDANGGIYVADWRNDRVQKFSPDGEFIMGFGSSGIRDGEFDRPAGVAIDRDGTAYVADWRNDRVQVFDENGIFLTKWLGDATLHTAAMAKLDSNPDMWQQRQVAFGLEREKLFWRPIAVEVDSQGRILALDSLRMRIQVYLKIQPYFVGLYDGGRL